MATLDIKLVGTLVLVGSAWAVMGASVLAAMGHIGWGLVILAYAIPGGLIGLACKEVADADA